jgi:Ras GTPase-activating-like protein IQGAP2/3
MDDAFLTDSDILFMDAKCMLIQIIRTLPPSAIERPLNLQKISNIAASNGKDPVLVTRGIKTQQMLKEIKDEDKAMSTRNYDLLAEEIEQELAHLGSLYNKTKEELQSLHSVYKSINDHNKYLRSQLDTYKAYLQNVRSQATNTSPSHKQANVKRAPSGTFTHQQLFERGVITTSMIPPHRFAYV